MRRARRGVARNGAADVEATAAATPDGLRRWVVLLEAMATAEGRPFDKETGRALLSAIGSEDMAGLHCPDRVALQVSVSAVDMAEALSGVLSRWRTAAARLALQGWDVVRAEVLTPEEFRRDCEAG